MKGILFSVWERRKSCLDSLIRHKDRWGMLPANGIIVVITAGLLVWMLTGRSEGKKAELLSIEPSVLDLGRLRLSSNALEAKFRMRNVSKQRIVIAKVLTSCGCTTAGLDGLNALDPGEERVIQVKLDNDRLGDRRSEILIQGSSENGNKVSAKAEIMCRGVTAVSCSANQVRLGRVSVGGESAHVNFTLQRGEEPIAWDGVECFASETETVCTPIGENQFNIEVFLREESKNIGAKRSEIAVYPTRDGKRIDGLKLEIPVYWETVNPNLEVHPSTILLGVIPAGTFKNGKISIASKNSAVLQGLAVSATSDSIRTELVSKDSSLECVYSVEAPAKKGNVSAVIVTSVSVNGIAYSIRTLVLGFVQ